MFRNFLYILVCLRVIAGHAAAVPHEIFPSQPRHIWRDVVSWTDKFGSYIKGNADYQYFASRVESKKPLKDGDDFEETEICSIFTRLRCATGFAMVCSDSVPADVFASALKRCHASEIYQIFVAADSHYKGLGDSRKAQMLKNLALQKIHDSPKELNATGALLDHAWLPKEIRACQSSILERELPWLQAWVQAHSRVDFFLNYDISPRIIDVFLTLENMCKSHPYALSHIQKSDIQKYAYALVPALCKGGNLATFHSMVRASYPCGPQKEELCDCCEALGVLFYSQPSQQTGIPEYPCTVLVGVIWDAFRLLNVHITQKQWSLCVAYLRHNHRWVNDAFIENNPWLMDVFAYRELPQQVVEATTGFHYYRQYHAPYIFHRHKVIINDLYKLLEKYALSEAEEAEKEIYKSWKKKAYEDSLKSNYCFVRRRVGLTVLHSLRCCTLWSLAKKEKLSSDFSYLYSTCTHAEKKALCLSVQRADCAETPGMNILKSVALPNPTEDLSRLPIWQDLK